MRGTTRLASLALTALLVPAAVSAEEGVRLLVRTHKSAIASFEPVIVTYDIVNVSDEPQRVPSSIDFSMGRVKFEVTDRNGRFRPYFTGVNGCGPMELVTLKPGERLSEQVIVLTNALVGFAESEIELGGYREASTALNRVVSEFALSNSARRAKRLLDGLANGYKTRSEIFSH
jgi:hypothetical protein